MPTRQPARCRSTTTKDIEIDRIINDLCAGLTSDAVPAGSLPVWCDIAVTFPIRTKGTTAKVVLSDLVVSCEGVQDIIVGAMLR